MLLSKYAVCDSKESRFIKEKEASELLSSLRITTPLSQIPLVGTLFSKDGDFKDLHKITASDKILHDKTFNIAKQSKYDGCQRGLALMA